MEQRIEQRVAKIIQLKETMMKEEKQIILAKFKSYENKVKLQRKQLGEAHNMI